MTFQHIQRKQCEQASRTKPAPAQLAELIKVANLVPPESDLPSPFDPLPDVPLPTFGLGAVDQYFINLVNIKFPKTQFAPFRQYLGQLGTNSNARPKYQHLRAAREMLRAFANEGKDSPKSKEIKLRHIHEALVNIRADERGRIQFSHGPIMDALRGVEVARIRLCPICGKIFWAGRLDQRCCSGKCSHVRRTRLWRASYQSKYKEQRVWKAEAEEGRK
jgi:hypothetical protein